MTEPKKELFKHTRRDGRSLKVTRVYNTRQLEKEKLGGRRKEAKDGVTGGLQGHWEIKMQPAKKTEMMEKN